ncbi:Uncharacterised protein [Mycobacteroides abscessus]|uniref:Bacteriophage protein n=3 Tax=Mycobacteroides abscessus TaxID=36809 RepID=A0AB74FAA3_9MYCO|nr:hypothetical protein [Mycobacteroides abscessus]AMU26547.1 hypothetical protein A3N96_14880 [Mycobacteroides abscessus]AMU36228.1 hypothetical protein A3N98_14075 [Mycobacteroides abscessus]AMU41275.1 hypothetical protein A3N99_14670 [Mycobacteroides abscessus]AMU61251.1 hypothetical protein A3O03_14790 [Mycobacteroides abscessus]MBN7344638.1 hypothetical protein [Mycobacteroides abscessus subsp. massiliense]
MDTTDVCTCPDGRNHVDCQEHRCSDIRQALDTSIWIELAWEMDLNWAGNAGELFWQHGRIELWTFDQPPTEKAQETKHVE